MLAVTALVAAAGAGAITGISRSMTLEAARLRVLAVLLEARRTAYAAESTVEVSAAAGDTSLIVTEAGETRSASVLPAGTSVLRSNAAGRVRFFASGFADNATIVVGAADLEEERSVVVNQRGAIR